MRHTLYATSLAAAILYFCFALLAVFEAPTYLLWQLSIFATEWGYWFALIGLALLIGLWRYPHIVKLSALIAALGAVLLLTPLLRAAAQPHPLNATRLLLGTSMKKVAPTRHVFAQGLSLDFYEARNRLDLNGRHDRNDRPPLVLVIHGGSWRGGDPTQLPKLNWYLSERGYAVAAISYRLAPAHPFPAALDDVRAAIAFLKARAAALGFDPNRIVLLGRSAGGQLALLTAYTSNDPAIRGAISFYGVTDMRWGWDHPAAPLVLDSRGILRDYLGGSPEQAGAAYDAASPVNFVATATPTLLIHGGRDELVFVQHSRMLADRLRRAGKT
ncbi:MAG: alpha/beta fold hydrolase, partial [Gemmatimonadota bacterium]